MVSTLKEKQENILDKKIGDKIDKESLGILKDMFGKKIRLMKITYTIQDENGVTMDTAIKHKEYIEEEDDERIL